MSEWIAWSGNGSCPVDRDARVDVEWLDGEVITDTRAGDWIWRIDVAEYLDDNEDSGAGIICRYRISPPHEPSSPSQAVGS